VADLTIPISLDRAPLQRELREAQRDIRRAIAEETRAAEEGERAKTRARQQAYRTQSELARDASRSEQEADAQPFRQRIQGYRDQIREIRNRQSVEEKAHQENLVQIRERGEKRRQQLKQEQDQTGVLTVMVKELGNAYAGLAVAEKSGGAIREAMMAVAGSAAEARDSIMGMVDEMEAGRASAREIAALRGERPIGMFTVRMAREAAAAGIFPEQYQQVALGFEAYAGQYVGPEGATRQQLEAAGQKIPKEQALALRREVAGYAVGARGLGGEEASQLLGLIPNSV
jgi:hypothetical protein